MKEISDLQERVVVWFYSQLQNAPTSFNEPRHIKKRLSNFMPAPTQIAKYLTDLLMKAEYAKSAVHIARQQTHHSSAVWYHAIGMLNAFYALNEELVRTIKNSAAQDERPIVNHWLDRYKSDFEAFFGNARNIATHQGLITVHSVLKWEIDYANDTERPTPTNYITIERTGIETMDAEKFLNRCEEAFTFFHDKLLELIDAFGVEAPSESDHF